MAQNLKHKYLVYHQRAIDKYWVKYSSNLLDDEDNEGEDTDSEPKLPDLTGKTL
jgi:hypothetical protein